MTFATPLLTLTARVPCLAVQHWKFRMNRRYYAWVKPERTRMVAITKGAGDSIGMGLRGGGASLHDPLRISYVVKDSPCAEHFLAGDVVHLIDGCCHSTSRAAAAHLLRSEQIYMLVSTMPEAARGAKEGKAGDSGSIADCVQSSHTRVAPEPPESQLTPTQKEVSVVILPLRAHPIKKMRRTYLKAYRAATRQPKFKSLPDALFWPNPEILLLACFGTGLVQAASSVLGAAFAGYGIVPVNLVTAVVCILLLAIFYGHQCRCLFTFYRLHLEHVWQDAERPDAPEEQEDPLLALGTRVTRGKLRPSSREQGSFEPPEEVHTWNEPLSR